jgi:hypothetical protein
MEEAKLSLGDPETVVIERKERPKSSRCEEAYALRIDEVRNDDRERETVFREPPGKTRAQTPQGFNEVSDERVSLLGIYPAVESAAGAGVTEHGVEARAWILEVMKDADAVDEIEWTEVDPRQVSAVELDPGPGDVSDVAPRGLESVPELDSTKTRGAESGHVMKERAVTESELEHFLPAKSLEIERGHPIEELRAGVGGARRKPVPGFGESVGGLDVVESHGGDEVENPYTREFRLKPPRMREFGTPNVSRASS